MARLCVALTLLAASLSAPAQKSAVELIALSAKPNDEFRAALIETMGEENIVKGAAWAGHGPDFIFAVEATKSPVLFVDDKPIGQMRRVKGWNMWYYPTRL